MIKVAKLSTSPDFFKWDFIDKSPFDIKRFIRKKDLAYDSDTCGDDTSFWVVVVDGNPKFYKADHNWYWRNYGEEDSDLINEFDITEVNKDDLGDYAKNNVRFVV